MNQDEEFDSRLLAWAARRAGDWPHLFASVIDRYVEVNKLDEQALCARLGCDRDTLDRLRLCSRPDPDPMAFAIDVQRVADKLGLDAGFLASIVREVEADAAFRRAGHRPLPFPSSYTPGMLRAARDREDEEPGEAGDGAGAGDKE